MDKKVSGNTIISAIELYNVQLEMLNSEFTSGMLVKEGELEVNLSDISNQIESVENSIAVLQAAQSRINTLTNVSVTINGNTSTMTLSQAIKAKGGYDRAISRWKTALAKDKDDKNVYAHNPEKMKRSVSKKDCALKMSIAKVANRAYQGAISNGNRAEYDVNTIAVAGLSNALAILNG